MLRKPDCLPVNIDSPSPVVTKRLTHPFLSLILSTQFPSTFFHPLSVSALFPPSFCFSHTQPTFKKLITTQLDLYVKSKPLILRGEEKRGRVKCFLPSNLKIAACQTETQSRLCATVGSLISNVLNLIVRGTLL